MPVDTRSGVPIALMTSTWRSRGRARCLAIARRCSAFWRTRHATGPSCAVHQHRAGRDRERICRSALGRGLDGPDQSLGRSAASGRPRPHTQDCVPRGRRWRHRLHLDLRLARSQSDRAAGATLPAGVLPAELQVARRRATCVPRQRERHRESALSDECPEGSHAEDEVGVRQDGMRRELRVITTRCRQHTLLTGGGTCTCAWMEVPFNSRTHAVIMKLVFINATIYKNLIVLWVLYYCESVLWPRARARCVCLCVRGGRAAGARCACCTPASIERASKRATLVIRGRAHATKSISTIHLCWRRLPPCRKDTGTFRSATASLGVSASHQSNTKPYRYDGFSAQNGDT